MKSKAYHHKPQYDLSWFGPHAHGLLTAIAPHLVIKRHIATHAIAFHIDALTTDERHTTQVEQPLPCSENPCPIPAPVTQEAFWGYMGGVIDSEGCITINDRLFRLEVTIANTHRCLLLYLQHYSAIHCTMHTAQPKNPRHASITRLCFLKDAASILLKHVLRLLHVKSEQAQKGMQFHNPDSLPWHTLNAMKEIHKLNRVGVTGQLSLFR